MIKLVIFDLDGTLVNTLEDIADSANHVLKTYGLPLIPAHEVKKHIGSGLRTLLTGIAPEKLQDKAFLMEAINVFHEHHGKVLLNNSRYFEGAESFIERTSKSLGIATNKPEKHARTIINGLSVPTSRFVDIVGGDRFPTKKPDPVQIQHLLALTSVKPAEAVLIGDSPQDLGAARASGVHSISVTFGYNTTQQLKDAGAEIFIDHFNQLDTVLKQLET